MQTPIYSLPGVVKSRTEAMEDFQGPLDLILSLLAKNKIAIRDIVISDILQQYLEQLARMEQMDIEVTSEFIVMASHLVYLKTKQLLQEDAKQELSELEEFMLLLEQRQNAEYLTSLRQMAPWLSDAYEKAEGSFIRQSEPLTKEKGYRYTHSATELSNAVMEILTRDNAELSAQNSVKNALPKPVYPVERKMSQIITSLLSRGEARLSDLFSQSKSRSEIVATFLAVLQLCRNSEVKIKELKSDFKLVCTPLTKESENLVQTSETTEEGEL